MKKRKPLFTGSDWTLKTIEDIYVECQEINNKELHLPLYPNQFEIITSSQMLDAYTSIGMPLNYSHWSYGKSFVTEEKKYRSGRSGLAYEIVSNTSPCVNYLMEENSAATQALVIAHAAIGHNNFFNENYLFKDSTQADSIVEYLNFAKKFISDCETRYGRKDVELTLDSAHALQAHGIDKYKRPGKLNLLKETEKRREREDYLLNSVNEVLDTTAPVNKISQKSNDRHPSEPQENILKFIEKNSRILKPWQREIIRIVRVIAQYFRPQGMTQIMNEGWACYTHMNMMNRLYDKGLITEGAMLEIMALQSGVVAQPNYQQAGAYFNPYALGLEIYRDIERIANKPSDEDLVWFPEFAGKENHMEVVRNAVRNYRDESFIRQFLSPKIMRQFGMFQITDNDEDTYVVSYTQNENGYKSIRTALANQCDANRRAPDIQIYNSNLNGTRLLELRHTSVNGELLDDRTTIMCLEHLKRLWGYQVEISTYDADNKYIKSTKSSMAS